MVRKEFIEYYEKPHLDLIVANVPKHSDFRRTYPAWHRSDPANLGSRPFDALTAITYESSAKFDEAMHIYYGQPFNQTVTEDELRFIDRSLVKLAVVDEVIDRVPVSGWRPAPVVADYAKLIRLIKRPTTLGATEFCEIYEAVQAPIIRCTIDNCIDYRRNYVRGSHQYNYTTLELQDKLGEHPMTDCDLIEELYFVCNADAKDAAVSLSGISPSALLTGV